MRVLLVDDHDIVRRGIRQLLDSEKNVEVVGEGSNGKEALQLIDELNPDVVVMDVGMPEMNGVEVLEELKRRNKKVNVLMLSMFEVEEYVLKAVELGALGYVLKDSDSQTFLKAIEQVYQGKNYYGYDVSRFIVQSFQSGNKSNKPVRKLDVEFSNREKEIINLVSQGLNNKSIAEELGISVRTIETHRLNIMKKMGVKNVAEMVRVSMEAGIV